MTAQIYLLFNYILLHLHKIQWNYKHIVLFNFKEGSHDAVKFEIPKATSTPCLPRYLGSTRLINSDLEDVSGIPLAFIEDVNICRDLYTLECLIIVGSK